MMYTSGNSDIQWLANEVETAVKNDILEHLNFRDFYMLWGRMQIMPTKRLFTAKNKQLTEYSKAVIHYYCGCAPDVYTSSLS